MDRNDMNSAYEEIAYLARSESRVAILRELVGTPRVRSDLREAVGVSRATMARLLNELVVKGYVERDGPTYRTTPLGELVVEAFDPLEARMTQIANLRAAAEWFPHEAIAIPFREFADAEVLVPSDSSPTGHLDRQEAIFRTATEIHFCTFAAIYGHSVALRDGVRDGSIEVLQGVGDDRFAARVRGDNPLREVHREIVESGGDFREYDGELPFTFFVADERVLLWICRDGVTRALLVSDSPTVHEWAEQTFEEYWAESDSMTAESLTVQ